MISANLLKYEYDLWKKGINLVAGVDEVGRGSLAGPLVVSAVILNPDHLHFYPDFPDNFELYNKINDSKLVTPKKREEISKFLLEVALGYSIIEIDNNQIDKRGISACTNQAFYLSVKQLKIAPEHIMTDSYEIKEYTKETQTNLIHGDRKSISIAAASIIAKVYRDNLMIEIHKNNPKYQVYGFDRHKGYGTAYHQEMIKKHGYSDFHRKSFKLKH